MQKVVESGKGATAPSLHKRGSVTCYTRTELLLLDPHNCNKVGEAAAARIKRLINRSDDVKPHHSLKIR